MFKSQNGENRYQTEFELEYGFTDAWQLQLEWDGLIHRELFRSPDQTEAGDFSIGTQYSFMGLQDGYSHAALGLNLGVPVGDVDRGMSDGFLELKPISLWHVIFQNLTVRSCFHRWVWNGSAASERPITLRHCPMLPIRFLECRRIFAGRGFSRNPGNQLEK